MSIKKAVIILAVLTLITSAIFAVLYINIKEKTREEIKIIVPAAQEAPEKNTEKIITEGRSAAETAPEEEKEALLEIIKKKEEGLPPEEIAEQKAAAEKERLELLEFLNNNK